MQRAPFTPVLPFLCILFLFLLMAPWCRSAESTADVPADAALKEDIRRQILGGEAAKPPDEEYRIGHRDIIHVSIYGEGSMAAGEGIQPESGIAGGQGPSGTAGAGFIRGRDRGIEVRIDGRASLRHIGDVSVVGMTLTQLADYLKKLYSTIYDNPVVTVTLVQSNSQQYTVMGQVATPGLYHLDFPLTIVRAVARAGGFTEWAKNQITVIRQQEAGGQTFKFDYGDFLKGKDLEKNIIIAPGDVIVVH
ncbi:MAG: polysaccharide biosynthesis/export family protein [Desulfobulbaceae bacterium]|jgi:polysaccharide export outer membrane protein|nr:polysaccharide biosynthesis/export family protein [Lascolabacillus sp.]MDD3618657.1 polysaccharide biosynthesis/export family protein [Desulfobulbaceae bacterium]MDY0352180.1 polysaccharide biosynthesis/export family protein [Desulfobulbaceae bacterium]